MIIIVKNLSIQLLDDDKVHEFLNALDALCVEFATVDGDWTFTWTTEDTQLPEVISVKDAAQRLGISDSHCRRLLETGKIKGKKLGHDWIVLSLDYKRKRRPKRAITV